MFKLVLTLLTLTQPPDKAPAATTATSGLDFADAASCARVLEGFRSRGDHEVVVRGVSVTLHFVGGKCVQNGADEANRSAQPDFDPYGLLPR